MQSTVNSVQKRLSFQRQHQLSVRFQHLQKRDIDPWMLDVSEIFQHIREKYLVPVLIDVIHSIQYKQLDQIIEIILYVDSSSTGINHVMNRFQLLGKRIFLFSLMKINIHWTHRLESDASLNVELVVQHLVKVWTMEMLPCRVCSILPDILDRWSVNSTLLATREKNLMIDYSRFSMNNVRIRMRPASNDDFPIIFNFISNVNVLPYFEQSFWRHSVYIDSVSNRRPSKSKIQWVILMNSMIYLELMLLL